jgi:hypothetical protein
MEDQNERKTVGGGKVETQEQDSHFPTAQISLRRKEKNCRLPMGPYRGCTVAVSGPG